jgi:hypothetical protein
MLALEGHFFQPCLTFESEAHTNLCLSVSMSVVMPCVIMLNIVMLFYDILRVIMQNNSYAVCRYAECHHAEYGYAFFITLSVFMLNIVMLMSIY